MCSKPKSPRIVDEQAPKEKDPIVLTRGDTAPSGATAAKRRKSKVRLDLNTASAFQGLTIPRG